MPKSASALLAILLAAAAAGAETSAWLEPSASDAIRVVTIFGPVLVTPSVPEGQYGERYAEGAYWLPGVTEGTSLVRKVIREARGKRDSGTRVRIHSYLSGGLRVWVTESRPFAGVYRLAAGEGWAWIAGVERPDPEQRAALEAAAADWLETRRGGSPRAEASGASARP